MNVGSLCRRHIVSIDGNASLAQAASLMRDQHVGALIVTTASVQGTQVSGIVTDRDLVIDVLARGLDPGGIRVGELAGTRLASVFESDGLSVAIEAMHKSGVRRLLVTDGELRLTGVVSLDDLLAACAADLDGLAKAMLGGIEREAARASKAAPMTPVLRVPAMGTAGWQAGSSS